MDAIINLDSNGGDLEDMAAAPGGDDVSSQSWHAAAVNDGIDDKIRETGETAIDEVRRSSWTEIRNVATTTTTNAVVDENSIVDSLENYYRPVHYKVNAGSSALLGDDDEWKHALEDYLVIPSAQQLFKTLSPWHGTNAERYNLFQKLDKFVVACIQEMDGDKASNKEEHHTNSSTHDEQTVLAEPECVVVTPEEDNVPALIQASQESPIFTNVKTRFDLAVLEYCLTKIRGMILESSARKSSLISLEEEDDMASTRAHSAAAERGGGGGGGDDDGRMDRFVSLLENSYQSLYGQDYITSTRTMPLFSVMETCVLAGAGLDAVERVLRLFPEALIDWTLIANALEHGTASMDVVSFLVDKLPNQATNADGLLIHACRYGARNDVILALAKNCEGFRGDILVHACRYLNDSTLIRQLADQYCKGPSQIFLNDGRFLGGKLDCASCPNGLDVDLVSGLQKLLFVAEQVSVGSFASWTIDAFLALVKLILSSKNHLGSLFIDVPSAITDSTNRGSPCSTTQLIQEVATRLYSSNHNNKGATDVMKTNNNSGCGVKSLSITTTIKSGFPLLQGIIVHLPNLQELCLVIDHNVSDETSCCDYQRHIAVIARVLRISKINSLTIGAEGAAGLGGAVCWFPLLDELKTNKHLTTLSISRTWPADIAPLSEKLGECIQSNTSLRTCSMERSFGLESKCFGELHVPIDTKADYYVALNRAGRALIRNSDDCHVGLSLLVTLLSSLFEEMSLIGGKKRREIAKQNITIVQYGLLREMPRLWSNNVVLTKGASRRRMPSAYCGWRRRPKKRPSVGQNRKRAPEHNPHEELGQKRKRAPEHDPHDEERKRAPELDPHDEERKMAPEHDPHDEELGLGWQSDTDHQERKMIVKIFNLLQEKKPDASKDSLNKLPQMANRMEEALYLSAESFQQYSDASTLKDRLKQLTVNIGIETDKA